MKKTPPYFLSHYPLNSAGFSKCRNDEINTDSAFLGILTEKKTVSESKRSCMTGAFSYSKNKIIL